MVDVRSNVVSVIAVLARRKGQHSCFCGRRRGQRCFSDSSIIARREVQQSCICEVGPRLIGAVCSFSEPGLYCTGVLDSGVHGVSACARGGQ